MVQPSAEHVPARIPLWCDPRTAKRACRRPSGDVARDRQQLLHDDAVLGPWSARLHGTAGRVAPGLAALCIGREGLEVIPRESDGECSVARKPLRATPGEAARLRDVAG